MIPRIDLFRQTTDMPSSETRETLFTELQQALDRHEVTRLVLSRPQRKDPSRPSRMTIRPVQVKDQVLYQWAQRIGTQETHKNLTAEETLRDVLDCLENEFREANIQTTRADLTVRASAQGLRIKRKSTQRESPSLSHNREKQYLIPEGEPCPFLAALGVMTSTGKVHAKKQHKFRQINRYLEFVEDVYDQLPPEGTLRVVDFGCGLSYLTFALHHLLQSIHGRDVEILGIDRNPSVIDRCGTIASQLDLPGLRFQRASLEEARFEDGIHLAVSLHACDTATDAALAEAVARRARVILAAPCCQHEVSRHMASAPLDFALDYGILQERIAAISTDALRATALEAVGYRTQLLEFIDLEHTPKNLLIRAVHQPDEDRMARYRQRFAEAKAFLHLGETAIDSILDRATV